MDKPPREIATNCAACTNSIVGDPMPTLVRDFRLAEADIIANVRRLFMPQKPARAPQTVDLCTPCQLDKRYGKWGTLQEGVFEAVGAIATAHEVVLPRAFLEEVFVGLIRRGLFWTDPGWRDEDPLTFHVDQPADYDWWDTVRAEFARVLWMRRDDCPIIPEMTARIASEFGPEAVVDALQLVAREALDECALLARLYGGDVIDQQQEKHQSLKYSLRDLRAWRKRIRDEGQFQDFLDCVASRLKAQALYRGEAIEALGMVHDPSE